MAIGTRASCQRPSGACARLPNSPPLSRIDQIERDRPATTLAAWLTKKSQPSPRGRCRGRDRASVIESHSGLPDDIGTAPPVLKDRDRNKFTRFLFVPSPRRGGLGRGTSGKSPRQFSPLPSPPRRGEGGKPDRSGSCCDPVPKLDGLSSDDTALGTGRGSTESVATHSGGLHAGAATPPHQ